MSVDIVPIVVDCFGFTGTEPLLDPNAGAPSFFNLQFIPLIKPVRLMESWLQQMSLMAAKGLPNPLQPNVRSFNSLTSSNTHTTQPDVYTHSARVFIGSHLSLRCSTLAQP